MVGNTKNMTLTKKKIILLTLLYAYIRDDEPRKIIFFFRNSRGMGEIPKLSNFINSQYLLYTINKLVTNNILLL